MNESRSRVHGALGAAVLTVLLGSIGAGHAGESGYPTRPVRIVVPLAPGGGTDNITRIIAPKLSELLGQQVVVENRPGAGGQIGTAYVAKVAPDGYTILNVESSFTSNPSLFSRLPYDTLKDFAPITLLATAPNVLIVHPSVPARTLKELVALGRARPKSFTFAMGGLGTATHLGIEQFRSASGIDLVVVPYKSGGLATADVVAGQVTMLFGGTSSASGFVNAGRLRAIAVTGNRRSGALPQVPTFRELGMPEVDSQSQFGSVGPGALPREIVATLNAAMRKALLSPEVQKPLADRGYEIVASTPEEHAANIRGEIEKWAQVVRSANIPKVN